MKTCPKCLNVFPDSVDYCTNDGSPLVKGSPKIRCNRCGSMFPYTPNGKPAFCSSCGEPFEKASTKEDSNNQWTTGRIIALSSIGVSFISTFLPFFTVNILGSKVNVSLWSKNFIVTTVIEIILIALCLIPVLKNSKSRSKAIIFAGLLILVDVIGNYIYNMNRLGNYSDDYFGEVDLSGMLSPGVGFYVLLACGVMMIVSGVIMNQERSRK